MFMEPKATEPEFPKCIHCTSTASTGTHRLLPYLCGPCGTPPGTPGRSELSEMQKHRLIIEWVEGRLSRPDPEAQCYVLSRP